jgi:tungstate transport system ATP-binding protein
MDKETGPVLRATGIRKLYGGQLVLDIEDFEVRCGEVVVVLGPSGTGKSVFLRILNLLEQPTAGTVRFMGQEVTGLEGAARLAVSRRMALIFQDPLLFRGTVEDNVAYGMKVRRVPVEERKARVAELLGAVRLEGLSGRYVTTLSGGEAQRVALARALVIEPEVLFLDEPFASLDTPTRLALQDEVSDVLRERGITAVFVTHDQEEAARLGDRILVLNEGRIIQQGSPRDIFYEPESEFVAGFVGFDNIYDGEVVSCEEGLACASVEGHEFEAVTDISPGAKVRLGIRPEDVTLVPASTLDAPASSRNAFVGEVTDIELRGPVARVTMACPFPLVALVTRRSLEELGIEVASEIGARFKATAVVVIGEHR